MRHSLGSGGYCGALASVLVAGLVADALADPGGGGGGVQMQWAGGGS